MAHTMKIILVFMSTIICVSVSAQCKTDLEREKIAGQVKRIIETGIDASDGKHDIDHIKTTEYSKGGRAEGYTFASKYNDLKPTKTIFQFDSNGFKISEERYNLKDKVEATLKYRNDDKGNILQQEYYTQYGKLDSYSYFSYNEQCERTEYKSFASDSSIWLWYTYVYPSENTIKITDKVRNEKSIQTKDKMGNTIENKTVNSDGIEELTGTYTYKYDKKGNWTRKSTIEDGQVVWIIEREIIYY